MFFFIEIDMSYHFDKVECFKNVKEWSATVFITAITIALKNKYIVWGPMYENEIISDRFV